MSKKRREIPVFDHPIIETHCHLDYLRERPLAETLQQSQQVNIEKVITIAVSPENLAEVRQLSGSADWVYGTQGVHPHEAEAYTDAVESEIREHATDDNIVAVGEIGLDYFYDNADRAVQREVFRRQLQVACDTDRPVVIHSRDADEDTIAILREFEQSLSRRGVIHSFTSGPGLAQYALDQGWCLGFNGITTFNKAENVRDIVRMTPIGQILLETDAPFLTPVPYRGRENAPFYLPFIAEKIADIKALPLDQVLTQTYQNSLRTFFPTQ
ncbi:TatD family hydrolase [Marinobacter daepoensis]|uniref:TatD family hydrolase n=1 Tax=Marinobacter daepoensis TaxID=262077 RepID=A0ABS3BEC0_9GAMM|nr:TatD family hydrolase [Marinobacter daepoensis]MBN7770184.1 TatD family hydrolase [Marinobacter daepoensis]MBY6033714.1 TatD family hydrolase [Marinobacter daepoensis]MBY6079630.1 TatD family hydrolase [Marinobacter daepoensis]